MSSCDDPRQRKEIIFFHDHRDVCQNYCRSRLRGSEGWSNVCDQVFLAPPLPIPVLHRKEVSFDSGKVLLSRLGDKVHATSAFCTHYGAPLVKGVLTADGRVVW